MKSLSRSKESVFDFLLERCDPRRGNAVGQESGSQLREISSNKILFELLVGENSQMVVKRGFVKPVGIIKLLNSSKVGLVLQKPGMLKRSVLWFKIIFAKKSRAELVGTNGILDYLLVPVQPKNG